MNGLWVRGLDQVGNTFVRFAVTQGFAIDGDLRDNLGVVLTPLVDGGPGANDAHTALVGYNNAVGNSYQLLARAGSAGEEQLGSVLFAPPVQCELGFEPALPSSFNHVHDRFHITVSQAQCSGDQVQFHVDHPAHGPGGTAIMNVTILDGDTGLPVLVIDEIEMFQFGAVDQVRFFNRTLPPGPWLAFAIHDDVVATSDLFDSMGFNVPRNACEGLADADLAALLSAIAGLDTNVTIGNLTVEDDDLQFEGLTSAESWTFLFLFAIFILTMMRGWFFVMGGALAAVPMVFIDNWPVNFTGHVFLIVILIVIQWFANLVWRPLNQSQDMGKMGDGE